ncbi:hypothetical protein GGX14DRAFT_574781 [Mycena pura]|uniref:Uncharacterized protein n=1 Tax=Mycena pura TaxID=153505 RepID=A0AAD6Y4V3_9AGAR|nr:hypothetical protein GGX14DRAFT_574781 [Mycena pura]
MLVETLSADELKHQQVTFGGFFESDGRLMGQEDIKTVQCDTSAQTCSVKVPAPGFLLANIQQRVGSVCIRVGGNTQESAKLVDSLPGNVILQKNLTASTGTTH